MPDEHFSYQISDEDQDSPEETEELTFSLVDMPPANEGKARRVPRIELTQTFERSIVTMDTL